MTLDEELDLFQSRNQLLIPGDLRSYLKLSDEEIDAYNEDMFAFFKFPEFKSVKEVVGYRGGAPDYRNIVNTLPLHENCFVFAEYSIYVMVFVIRLYAHDNNKNEVYAICGCNYEVVANSFDEFIARYREDIGNVFI